MRRNGSGNIRLVPFRERHVPKTVEWVNDAEIINLIDRSSDPVTIKGCYEWYKDIAKDKKKSMFAVIVNDKGLHIGNCGLFDISTRSKKAKLWLYIGEKCFWNKGLGREVLEKLLNHGFTKLNLNKIYLYVVKDNVRAQRLYESAGFVKEGIFRQDAFLEGKFKDTIYYGMLKKEFKERPKDGAKKTK